MLLPLILAAFTPATSAFPFLVDIPDAFAGGKRGGGLGPVLPQDTSNCGEVPCLIFNQQDQYVDVSDAGLHPFIPPGTGDIRGLCPGLNAAANHGFLPRNGLLGISQTADGLQAAYNMAPELGNLLAVISIALTGDPISQTWSIGGSFPATSPGGLLNQPGGISNSHNKYEADASVTRGDAYLNGGKGYIFQTDKFTNLYNLATTFDFPTLREHNKWVWDQSISTNPYYFSAGFSGLVAPAAYHFVVNFMSNHSAANPEGTLTREVLKSFWSVTGEPGSFVHTPGHERIPYNWYRRPTTDQHDTAKIVADLTYTAAKYPEILSPGGNLGQPNTFAGVDFSDLSGGVFTAANIFEGNNLGCFIFQAFESVLPDELAGIVKDVAPVLALVKKYADPVIAKFDCPQLTQYNQGLFNQFPGYHYSPAAGPVGTGSG